MPEPQIFCDLDGVLVDFVGGLNKVAGRDMSDCGETHKWSLIKGQPHFFTMLEWCEGAAMLWDFICSKSNTSPKILTATPGAKLGKRFAKDKRIWCKKHLGSEVTVHTCLSEEKSNYSGQQCVLIDDSLKHKDPWEEKGGVFIHHTSIDRTLWLLRRLFMDKDLSDSLTNAQSHFDYSFDSSKLYSVTNDRIVMVEGSKNEECFLQAMSHASTIAIDAEWVPDVFNSDTQKPAAIVQVAVDSGFVFVIDWLIATEATKYTMIDVLWDPTVLKIGFGFAPDLDKLCLHSLRGVRSVVDLQKAMGVLFDQKDAQLSLRSVVAKVLGITLIKGIGKLSHDSWETRPLLPEMIQYAACDAAVLLDLYESLISEPSSSFRTALWALQCEVLPTKSTRSTVQSHRKGDVAHPEAVAQAAAIYLDANSRAALLAACPARHKQLHADHVTLLYQPARHQVQNLRVGSEVTCSVTSEHFDRTCQAVCVTLDDNTGVEPAINLHVTISTLQGVGPVDSIRLLGDKTCQSRSMEAKGLRLCGIVGLRVVLEIKGDLLTCLQTKIKQEVLEFVDGAHPGETLKLKHLSPTERHVLHEFSALHGLHSRSEGVGDARKLILQKEKKRAHNEIVGKEDGRIVSCASDLDKQTSIPKTNKNKDQTLTLLDFASFKLWLTGPETTTQGPGYDGRCHSNYVEWLQRPASSLFELLGPDPCTMPEGYGHVVILRGVPGSGKSQLCRTMLSKYAPHIFHCSADKYFERGAGLFSNREMKGKSPTEIYSLTFSVDKLADAHAFCQAEFEEAFYSGSYSVIIVDNTNTRRSDYAFYMKVAEEADWEVSVVELLCPDDQVAAIGSRNAHNVPEKVIATMHQRLKQEPHEGALVLRPYFESRPSLQAASETDRWLMKHGCLHFNKGQTKTHLKMAVGDQPATFVNVPPALEAEFLQVYANDKTANYLCEYAGSRSRMFLDIDYEGTDCLTLEQTLRIAQVLQNATKQCYHACDPKILIVIVTGCNVDSNEGHSSKSTGLHLKMPHLYVGQEEALAIRAAFVRLLHSSAGIDPTKSWDVIVDKAVLEQHRTLRMLFSRKVSNKFVDMNRVYRLLAVVSPNGSANDEQLSTYSQDRLQLLEDASIRCHHTQKLTPGFSDPY